MSGSRPLAGSEASASPAIARAAARNSGSGIVEALATIVPARGPGTSARCWPGRSGRSCRCRLTGPNGLPVATRAAPSVHSIRFWGVCSASGVGIRHRQHDRARAVRVHRADDALVEGAGDARGADEHRRMQVVDYLGQAERPVGGFASRRPPRGPSRRAADSRRVPSRSLVSSPGRSSSQIRSAASCALSPSALIAWASRSAIPTPAAPAPKTTICWSVSRPPEDLDAGQRAGEPDRGRPLNVVVERAVRFAVARQDGARRRRGEVLPVQDRVGEALARGCHVGVDESLVLLTAGSRAAERRGSEDRSAAASRLVPTSRPTASTRSGSIPPATV